MSWKEGLPGWFGLADRILAGHYLDEQRFKEGLKDAKASGATYEDVEKEVVYFIYKEVKGPDLREHIDKQLKTLKTAWK